jgi:hypothetical protein
VDLAVRLSGGLALLNTLRLRLAGLGVRAELRDHLMSLVVFPPAPALPVCVFISDDGLFFSWDGGRRRVHVADAGRAAAEIAACAKCGPDPQPLPMTSG